MVHVVNRVISPLCVYTFTLCVQENMHVVRVLNGVVVPFTSSLSIGRSDDELDQTTTKRPGHLSSRIAYLSYYMCFVVDNDFKIHPFSTFFRNIEQSNVRVQYGTGVQVL